MTYRELLIELQKLDEDQLNCDINIYDCIMGYYNSEINFASCANNYTKKLEDKKLNCFLNSGNPVILINSFDLL